MEKFSFLTRRLTPALTGIIVFVTAATPLWLTYRTASEWQRSAERLASLRAEAGVNLLTTALTRDMRALQVVVLPSMPRQHGDSGSTEVLQEIASAFARYTYPEAFFSWDGAANAAGARSKSMTFYTRADRSPGWLQGGGHDRFPVVTASAPKEGSDLIERVFEDVGRGRRFTVFDVELGGQRYQAIAAIWYKDPLRTEPDRVFGFLVNLEWVRQSYFPEVTGQVSRLADVEGGLQLAVFDDRQKSQATNGDPVARRTFPILFFDPILIAITAPSDLRLVSAIAQASVTNDPMLQATDVGARRVLIIVTASTLLLIVGLVLTLQGAREKARLARLQSDFVSSVTHELKTPVATIRMISETFASARGVTPELSRKYGRLALHESQRLTRLINNLLAFARVNDLTEAYTFEQLALPGIVEKTLADFSSQLEYGNFELHVDLPTDLPLIRADARAMGLALSNLLDNAIRYSDAQHYLSIEARMRDGQVKLMLRDRGVGIPAPELAQITRKFFRGSRGRADGSGLGLAIVERIVIDHGGTLTFRSVEGEGTTVVVALPVKNSRT